MPVITQISYSKLLPTGVYSNERIGLDATVGENENVTEAMTTLRDMVEQLHKQFNPQYYQDNGHEQPKEGKPSHEEKTIEQMIEDMRGCSTVDELKSYRFLPSQNPKFKEAYDEMYKKLSA